MSKPFTLLAVLIGVVLLSAGSCVAMCLWYVRILSMGEHLQAQVRYMEAPMMSVNRNRALFQAIASEAMEFGKKNAAMNMLLQRHSPLLEQLNVKSKSVPAQAGQPAAR